MMANIAAENIKTEGLIPPIHLVKRLKGFVPRMAVSTVGIGFFIYICVCITIVFALSMSDFHL